MYVLPPVPRCSGWASSSLISPSRISLPRNCGRVGLHIVLFEACSAFTRVAARTLAPSPICDALYRRLQPFRHLHDCSGCFRLERSPGGACTHWKAPPFTAHANSGHSQMARRTGQTTPSGGSTAIRALPTTRCREEWRCAGSSRRRRAIPRRSRAAFRPSAAIESPGCGKSAPATAPGRRGSIGRFPRPR